MRSCGMTTFVEGNGASVWLDYWFSWEACLSGVEALGRYISCHFSSLFLGSSRTRIYLYTYLLNPTTLFYLLVELF